MDFPGSVIRSFIRDHLQTIPIDNLLALYAEPARDDRTIRENSPRACSLSGMHCAALAGDLSGGFLPGYMIDVIPHHGV
jgi:hypothetical protein